MKILSYFAGFVFLTICSSVSAIPILTTGGADTIVDYGTISPSSTLAETQFIADYLGVDVSTVNYSQLTGSGGEDGAWMQVDENPDLWAFDFGTNTIDLFIIKVGKNVGLVSDGTTDTFTHFLYENFNRYGVIDLGVFDRTKGNVEILMVSHVGVGTVTVPEPSLVALLGIGLLGVTFIRRRIIK